jgi:hypothetical protein
VTSTPQGIDNPSLADPEPVASQVPPGKAAALGVETNPDAPPRVRARSQSAPVNPFRLHIPDELIAARAQLVQQLGGHESMVKAQSVGGTSGRLGLENIQGVFIGKKTSNGRPTGKLALTVHVGKKVSAASTIDSSALIPPVVKVGGREFPTDVVPVGRNIAYQGYRDFEEPARGGCSIGYPEGTRPTGTLGCLVVLDDGKLCILSNNHVIAAVDSGQLDVTKTIHPGAADPSSQVHNIGIYHRAVPLNLNGSNTVDAAASLTNRERASAQHHEFTIDPEPVDCEINMNVKKEGRTTGYTEGIITGIQGELPVQYQRANGSFVTAYFLDTLKIEGINQPFSSEGDSGSLIVEINSNKPVALLFAGSDDHTVTYAIPITVVMDKLGIDHFVNS